MPTAIPQRTTQMRYFQLATLPQSDQMYLRGSKQPHRHDYGSYAVRDQNLRAVFGNPAGKIALGGVRDEKGQQGLAKQRNLPAVRVPEQRQVVPMGFTILIHSLHCVGQEIRIVPKENDKIIRAHLRRDTIGIRVTFVKIVETRDIQGRLPPPGWTPPR